MEELWIRYQLCDSPPRDKYCALQLIGWNRLPKCTIPGRELIKPPDTWPPGSICLSSREAVCCSYSAGVRLTFVLTFKLSASSFPVLSPAGPPPPVVPQQVSLILCDPGFSRGCLSRAWTGWGTGFSYFFSLRRGHRVTVKLLSGGNTSGISHVGSGEHFVFSLNKKRKRKHLQDSHLPGERGLGLLPWLEKACFSSGVWPGPSGDWGGGGGGAHPQERRCLLGKGHSWL